MPHRYDHGADHPCSEPNPAVTSLALIASLKILAYTRHKP